MQTVTGNLQMQQCVCSCLTRSLWQAWKAILLKVKIELIRLCVRFIRFDHWTPPGAACEKQLREAAQRSSSEEADREEAEKRSTRKKQRD